VFGKIAAELDAWLDAHDYGTAREITGRSLTRGWPPVRPEAPFIDSDACNDCGICTTSCVYGAIHVVDGRVALEGETCARCGLCVTRCRRGAIHWPAPPKALRAPAGEPG
jgi:heterodisulfide reductase subunit A-like polyferredoxin